jgi:hypothetical protein
MSMVERKWVSVGPIIIKNSASEYLREAIDALVIFFIAARYEPSRACFLNLHPVLRPCLRFHLSPSESEVQLPFRSSASPIAATASGHGRIPERGIADGLGSAGSIHTSMRLGARGSSGVGEVGVDDRRKLGAHRGQIEGRGG